MGRKSSAKQWEKKKKKSEKFKTILPGSQNEQPWDQEWSPAPIIGDPRHYIHEQFTFKDGYETEEESGVKPLHNRPPYQEKRFKSPPKLPSLFECSLIILKQKFSFNICDFILKDMRG